MAEKTSYTRHWLVRAGCFLVLVILAGLQLFVALREQLEYGGNHDSKAVIDLLRSPYLLTWHGKRLHMLEGKMAEAEDLFTRALCNNSFFIPAWLGLAELHNDQGRKPQSRAILEYVDKISKGINRWRWEKALLTYQLGQYDILARDLSYIIEKIPGKTRQSALKMAFSIWEDPDELLQQVGTQNVLELFNHACKTKRIATALAYWPRIEGLGVEKNRKDILFFISTLLSNDEMEKATTVWRKYFNPKKWLYDGSFADEPMNTAFGWHVGKPNGSTWRIESLSEKSNFNSLRLHFSGTENIQFSHVSQIIPLAPGKQYNLTGRVKTVNLTTDQRPYLEVVGYKCTTPKARSEKMADNQPWTTISLLVLVSEDCQAVQVRVRRDRSDHLDNLLAGDLWLTDLVIRDTGEEYSILDTKL